MTSPVALALLALGLLAVTFSAVGLLVVPNRYDRLHFLAPAATLGAPLIGVAVMVDIGFTAPTAKVVLIIAATALSTPVASAATGFAMRQQDMEDEP